MSSEALAWWKETLAKANSQGVPPWYLAWQEIDVLRCRVDEARPRRENKGGRPRKLSDADVQRAVEMRDAGRSVSEIAAHFKCNPHTIGRYFRSMK